MQEQKDVKKPPQVNATAFGETYFNSDFGINLEIISCVDQQLVGSAHGHQRRECRYPCLGGHLLGVVAALHHVSAAVLSPNDRHANRGLGYCAHQYVYYDADSTRLGCASYSHPSNSRDGLYRQYVQKRLGHLR